jgi:hypothetical protein
MTATKQKGTKYPNRIVDQAALERYTKAALA